LGYDNLDNDDWVMGATAAVTWEPDDCLTLFLRGEYRYKFLIDGDVEDPYTPRLQAVAGGTLRTAFGLTLHLAAAYIDGDGETMRSPVSIMMPKVSAITHKRAYLLSSARYTLELSGSRVDLGLSLFNPFGARFREQAGTRAPDGSNYGGEYIGTRAILSARMRY